MLRVHWLIWVFNIVKHVKEICRQYSPTNFVRMLIENRNIFSIGRLSNTLNNEICAQLSVCNSCMKRDLLFSTFSIENKTVWLWMNNFRHLCALNNNFFKLFKTCCALWNPRMQWNANWNHSFCAILMIAHIHSQSILLNKQCLDNDFRHGCSIFLRWLLYYKNKRNHVHFEQCRWINKHCNVIIIRRRMKNRYT